MEKTNDFKKSYGMLLFGTAVTVISLIAAIYTHGTSYAESKQLEDTALKLAAQRPYSYSLAALFLGILLLAKGFYNAFHGVRPENQVDVRVLAQAGLLATLCYVGFAFFKVDITVGASKTAFHLGNVFCVLAALLLGGYWGGLAGAIGMTIADLTTAYVTSAPKTFLLKLLIGLIAGFFAHQVFHIGQTKSHSHLVWGTVLSSGIAMAFNIIADPLIGYFYKTYLLGIPQDLAKTLAKLDLLTTSVNAVVAVITATIFYLALRPALKKAGLLVRS